MSFVRIMRNRPRSTIGVRLTLWGASITLMICVLICLLLYAGVNAALLRQIDTFLEGEVHEFMLTVNQHAHDLDGLQQAIRQELGTRSHHDLAFRLFDEQGRLIVSSESDDLVASAWTPPARWPGSRSSFVFSTVRTPDGRRGFRTCSLRVTTRDGRRCIAQASYTTERMEASLASFRRVCLAVLAFAATVSLLCGWFLARRSLAPVRTLTETAQRIGAANLSERVPVTGTGDELDRLAGTINAMLDRIERHVEQVRRFTADASHELRSPLAALRGNAEVALSRARSASELRRTLEETIA